MTILCKNRFERTQTIWQIEEAIRAKLNELEGIKSADVYDFGATANSSIKAALDVRLTASVPDALYENSKKVSEALLHVRGLTSVTPSWLSDLFEVEVVIDHNKALAYGLSPMAIVAQIPIRGEVVAVSGNLASMNNQPVRLYLSGSFQEHLISLQNLPITSNVGIIPLGAVAKLQGSFTPSKIERDGLLYSLDVNGYRSKRAISHITDDADVALKSLQLGDIAVKQEGDIVQLNDSSMRMLRAIGIGTALLFVSLMAIYGSAVMSLVMILVLPLSLIGAAWGMLSV